MKFGRTHHWQLGGTKRGCAGSRDWLFNEISRDIFFFRGGSCGWPRLSRLTKVNGNTWLAGSSMVMDFRVLWASHSWLDKPKTFQNILQNAWGCVNDLVYSQHVFYVHMWIYIYIFICIQRLHKTCSRLDIYVCTCVCMVLKDYNVPTPKNSHSQWHIMECFQASP